jgi:hypothetical protein
VEVIGWFIVSLLIAFGGQDSRDWAGCRDPQPEQTTAGACFGAKPFGGKGESRNKMLFMVIERFDNNDMVPIYERFRESGRGLPDGLEFVDSWVEANFARCFQIMRCDDPKLFQQWILHWRGTGVTMEIVPVVSSADTRSVVTSYIDAKLVPA